LTAPRFRPAMSRFASIVLAGAGLAMGASVLLPSSTQTAIANGDTRTLSFEHAYRKDSLTVTFRVNGSFDRAALAKLNHFLRDWRNDAQTNMDPRLFDVLWEAQRSAGASGAVIVLSAYRSPHTNAMLRARSRAVANNSQHMHGKALDFRFQSANMHRVREVAIKMQRGGVGWYGGSGFVHLDVGSVRAWPRMSYDQLARLFPNGESVHIASDGRTLPGYERARAMVSARNGSYVPTLAQTREKSFLARLFGWDEGDEADQAQARTARRAAPAVTAASSAPAPAAGADNNSAAAFFRADAARREASEQPAPQVAAAPARPAPVAAAPAAAVPAATVPAAARAPVETTPPRAAQIARAPLPPRRPSQAQIELAAARNAPAAETDEAVPLPPQRPQELLAVAAAAPKTVPVPQPREQVAALIGANAPGAVARTANLPAIITSGAPVAAHAGASAPLAYAPEIQAATGPVRKITPRRTAAKGLPSLSRSVGLRQPAAAKEENGLVAARLDRSNFASMTTPARLTHSAPASAMGSSVAPLRAAVRHDPSRLLFAPADAPASGFTRAANGWSADRFGPVTVRQAVAPTASRAQ